MSSTDFFKLNFFKKFFQEHFESVKQFGDILSILIWVQTVSKGYQQMKKVMASKERVYVYAQNPTLNTNAYRSSRATDQSFCLSFHLQPCFVQVGSEGSGKTTQSGSHLSLCWWPMCIKNQILGSRSCHQQWRSQNA